MKSKVLLEFQIINTFMYISLCTYIVNRRIKLFCDFSDSYHIGLYHNGKKNCRTNVKSIQVHTVGIIIFIAIILWILFVLEIYEKLCCYAQRIGDVICYTAAFVILCVTSFSFWLRAAPGCSAQDWYNGIQGTHFISILRSVIQVYLLWWDCYLVRIGCKLGPH